LAHFLDSNDQQLAGQEIHDEILVATPGRLLAACAKMPASFLGSLHFLVLDEADLLFSYGYKAEME
jgi:superfamily II DNA/RNA helicase